MRGHKVVTVERGTTDDGRQGYAARCEAEGCPSATFGGFPTRSAAREAVADQHEQMKKPPPAATDEGQNTSRANGSNDNPTTHVGEEVMPRLSDRTPHVHTEIRNLIDLEICRPFRNDPEGPMTAAVRYGSDGTPLVELGVDTATSGLEDVAWLTPKEAIAYAEAIIEVAKSAQSLPHRKPPFTLRKIIGGAR